MPCHGAEAAGAGLFRRGTGIAGYGRDGEGPKAISRRVFAQGGGADGGNL